MLYVVVWIGKRILQKHFVAVCGIPHGKCHFLNTVIGDKALVVAWCVVIGD